MSTITEVSKGGNVRFFINEEKRTVVARLNTDPDEPRAILDALCRRHSSTSKIGLLWALYSFNQNASVKPYYIGKAICDKRDTFDVEVGKQIALKKAKIKLQSDVTDKLAKIYADLDTFVGQLGHRLMEEMNVTVSLFNELNQCSGNPEVHSDGEVLQD